MTATDLAHSEPVPATRSRTTGTTAKETPGTPRGRRSNDQGHGQGHRLNVLFSDELNTKLEHVKKKTHAQTLAEVFRNALILYTHLFKAHENGDEIVLRSKDGKEKVIQVFM